MAITCLEKCEKNTPPSSSNSKGGTPGRLMKINFGADDIIATAKRGKCKKKSPYLHGEKIQLLSRITERRFVHKKADFKSSFPLAVNLYKASSDEFKALKRNKRKVKKSVLTLPNEQAPLPQTCTVSDMNDSEYYNGDDENKKAIKKKLPLPNRKVRVRTKGFEFYDRDARHCSQMSIDLDCSSTDLMKHSEGDRKTIKSRISRPVKKQTKEEIKPHDIWAVLRNINRFQYKPSPRISEDSSELVRKKNTFNRKRNNGSGRRLIETHRTKEITYVANFQLGNRSSSVSQSTSIDRITVIENGLNSPQENINTITKSRNFQSIGPNGPKKILDKTPNKIPLQYNLKSIAFNNNTGQVANKKCRVDKLYTKNNNNKVNISSSSSMNKDSVDSSNYYINCNNKNMQCTSPCSDPRCFENNCTMVNYYGSNKTVDNNICKEHDKPSPNDSTQILKGTPNVIFHNGQRTTKRIEELSCPKGLKPHLVTTMPSAATMPKLTTADIKRRLANIKFPLVILGKDQLSSNVEVADYDPPQFYGLNEHIVEWNKKTISKDKRPNGNNIHKRITQPREITTTKETRKFTNEGLLNKNIKDKKLINGDATSKKKTDHKKAIPADTNISLAPQHKKMKPIRQFKDKMLKILYKKPSLRNLIEFGQPINEQGDGTEKKVDKSTEKVIHDVEVADASTETHSRFNSQCKDIPSLRRPEKFVPMINKRYNGLPPSGTQMLHSKYPWARAKWASDFIDNIIRKIKDGAIYSQELTTQNKSSNGLLVKKITKRNTGSYVVDFKEHSIPTSIDASTMDNLNGSVNPEQKITQFLDLTPDHKLDKHDYQQFVLPGFDDILPELEIATLNVNQIEVKHCLTNLMVKFDVKVLDRPESEQIHLDVKKSTSCIPLSVTDGQASIIKYNTTILNAVLPAELCSVIPRIMRKYVDNRGLLTPLLNVSEANVSNISEIPGSAITCSLISRPLSIDMSPKLRKVLDGRFSKDKFKLKYTSSKHAVALRTTEKNVYNTVMFTILLSKLDTKPFFRIEVHPSMIPDFKETKSCLFPALDCIQSDTPIIRTNQRPQCMALQVYTPPTPILKNFSFTRMMEKMRDCRNFELNFNISFLMQPLRILSDTENDNLDVGLRTNQCLKSTMTSSTMTVTVNSFKIDSLYNGYLNGNNFANKSANTTNIETPPRSIGYQANSRPSSSGKKDISQNCNKLRRKGYVKLYRKCKSTTNISGEKCGTNLGKINNVDDFFQALGAGKNLSSVFDGRSGQMILSSLLEMKSWVSEITPRQALLVLLLTNKKDTPNLVRFRPIILQAIAVNRITRATELDMEIEVIERENLKISQYEGISYLPASAANQNNLFEELCWIAKTTASDYQKPFDESSERLLKSLLEKRKKLNPSYLRVMARYVGLGLLKTPAKN